MENHAGVEVTADLIEAIRSFPVGRGVEHCGTRFVAPPFDVYVDCPQCGARIKVRSFSGVSEIEDVFDAVFEWMNWPEARGRQAALKEESGPAAPLVTDQPSGSE